MLDRLIKQVIERLKIRETTKISISQVEMLSYGEELFIKAKVVRIQDIDRIFLNMLLNGENGEKQRWLALAKFYDVEIELELFDTGEPWLSYEEIAKITYPIFSKNGKQLIHVPTNVICYRDVALLDSGTTLLCKYQKQFITALAHEDLKKKQIDVQERV